MDKISTEQLKFPIQELKKDFDKHEFSIGASIFRLSCWHIVRLLLFTSGLMPFSNILVLLLRTFGAKIGREVRIKPGIYIKYPWKLKVGNFSWLADCYIENLDEVNIGNHVCISQKAMLLTGNHNYKSTSFNLMAQAITLEDGVWVGANATVCPGTTIRSHSVILVGSVISGLTQPYQIYKGNPAISIRQRVIKTSA
ncbi:WcaF family extracellular polysaccharide biosynthesis acetyltransferase [Pedobacter sp. PWIIR3]